ncbi:MAG: response regulator, partial [Candidatus Odinarchaeota archaeon]
MKILVVDDDPLFLDKMQKNLVIDDHSVNTVLSGEEALKEMNNNQYDLVLTDLKMEGLSGIDLIKSMRKNEIDSMTVVITGYGTIESAVEAMKVGAYDYILKPFKFKLLRSKLLDVENELKLRERMNASESGSDQGVAVFSEFDLNEFETPFLVISSGNPDRLIQKHQLYDVTRISISYGQEKESIKPTKLYQLMERIEEFIERYKKGTIIFYGLEQLLISQRWDNIKLFINYLRDNVISNDFTLLFLIAEEKNADGYLSYELLLHDALSLLSIQAFQTIIEVISHPVRRKIIILLKDAGKINFNKIAEELDIKNTANLAFHLKKLAKESVIKK